MPLFAPLSAAEKKSLRAAPALTLPQRLASMLQLHHTRVIDLFRALDKNEDGEVTKPELAEARAQFARAEQHLAQARTGEQLLKEKQIEAFGASVVQQQQEQLVTYSKPSR